MRFSTKKVYFHSRYLSLSRKSKILRCCDKKLTNLYQLISFYKIISTNIQLSFVVKGRTKSFMMEFKQFAVLLVVALIGSSTCERVQVPCTFSNTVRGYTCRLPNINLADQDYVIAGGEHLSGFNDASVVSFVSINNNFRSFPQISRFANLRNIQVTGGLIERLETNDIANRTALESLNLNNNQISAFDERTFATVPNLNDVTLRFNRIRNLIPAVFNAAVGLQNLDVSYNSVERLSSGLLFSSNSRLVSLQLSGNNIDFINQTIFNNLGALNIFDLSSNICYSGTFFGINQPSTRQQMMQRLQPCFSDQPVNVRCQFEFIEMNENKGYGCTLRDLQLYDRSRQVSVGGFHVGPNTNANVRFLRIELSRTPFIIRELFTSFPNLEGLEIIFSELSEISAESFTNARNLKYLNIRNNPIKRIEANVFQNATNLEELYLWWNSELNFVSENAFTGLENLRELHLISSNLPSILPRTFRPLTSLQLLELSQNGINYIDSRWFSTNRQLTHLQMNSNSIDAIHPSILDLPELTSLFLQGNRCVSNVFIITDSVSRQIVRNALLPCFDNYPTRKRRFVLDVEGDVTFFNESGNEIITL
jgi:Leucine-rich repeat (LRR) protein